MFDGALFGEEIVKEVRGFVEKTTAPLIKEIEGLRAKLAEIEARPVAETVKGEDGKSVTVEDLAPMVAEFVERAVAALPVPKDGQDGEDGKSFTVEDVQPLVTELVAKAVADLPKVKDGADGVGLAGALIDRDGALVVTLTDGTTRELGPVVGKDGDKGEPGADGVGFDDIDISRPDERTLVISFEKGEVRRSFEVNLEHPIYRGVFVDGETYGSGDMVTWAGSCWAAERSTGQKPGEAESGWKLAVKAGRPGKDAK